MASTTKQQKEEDNIKTPMQVSPVKIPPRNHELVIWMKHAVYCNFDQGKCPKSPGCDQAKKLWSHISECEDKSCTVKYCLSCSADLDHYRVCKETGCNFCKPIRQYLDYQKFEDKIYNYLICLGPRNPSHQLDHEIMLRAHQYGKILVMTKKYLDASWKKDQNKFKDLINYACKYQQVQKQVELARKPPLQPKELLLREEKERTNRCRLGLWQYMHGKTCMGSSCKYKDCLLAKDTIKHIEIPCRDDSCPRMGCKSFKTISQHYNSCKLGVFRCQICSVVLSSTRYNHLYL